MATLIDAELNGKTIFVGVTELTCQHTISACLTESGYNLHLARDGNNMLELARQARPDLLLLDTQVPELDAFEACQQAKADASLRDIPLILVISSEADKIRAFKLGANDWLSQPILREELLVRISLQLQLYLRRRTEEELRKSEERFRQVANNAQEWIWEVNADGLYTYTSPVIKKILGWDPDEVVGQKYFFDMFYPDDREELKETALHVFADQRSFREFINRNVRFMLIRARSSRC